MKTPDVMRPLTLLAIAAVLSGCRSESGGFDLYPQVPACSIPWSLDIGGAADGTLWLTYTDFQDYNFHACPAHFASGRWELGARFEAHHEGIGRYLGMRAEGPVVLADGFSSTLSCSTVHDVARYAEGSWRSTQTCGDRVSPAPDGRLYTLSVVGTDLHVSVLSPTWDSAESDTVVLTAGDAMDLQQGIFAFSPSAEPVFQYLVATSPRTVLGFRRWDGNAWGPAAADLDAGPADMAGAVREFHVDSQGRLWVTPGELPATTWRWTGNAWEDLGGLPGFVPSIEGPAVLATALDAEDRFLVTWTTPGEVSKLSLRRFGPSGWADLGPPIEERGKYIHLPDVTVAPDQTPIVAWMSTDKQRFLGVPLSRQAKVARYAKD